MSHRLTRRAPRSPHAIDLAAAPIASFTDAVGEAWCLHDRFGTGVAALALDDDGELLEAWVLTAPHRTIDDVVGLLIDSLEPGARVLLTSAHGDDDLPSLTEVDRAAWHHVRQRLDDAGFAVLDWIQSGGAMFRSLHFSCTVGQDWPSSAQEARRAASQRPSSTAWPCQSLLK